MMTQSFASRMNPRNWPDWLGVVASVACAIHCAAMPFVAMFLPMLGLSFLMDDSFHQVMVIVCSALAILAFIPGFRRHRSLLPIGVGVLGLCFISTAAFALEDSCCEACAAENTAVEEVKELEAIGITEFCTDECCKSCETATAESLPTENVANASIIGPLGPWITSLGGLLLVGAHLTNRQFSCRCGCCSEQSSDDVVSLDD